MVLPLCLSSERPATGFAIRCVTGPARGAWWSGGGWSRQEIAVYPTRGMAEEEQQEAGEFAPCDLVGEIIPVQRGRHYV